MLNVFEEEKNDANIQYNNNMHGLTEDFCVRWVQRDSLSSDGDTFIYISNIKFV